MIDITVDDATKVVEIEDEIYYYSNQQEVINLLHRLIDKVMYSGESFILYKAEGDKKRLIKEW